MLPKMLQLRSGGYGPTVTSADNRKAAAVTIGGTLALVIPLTWATARYGNDPYVFSYLFSFMTVSWLLPVAFSELNDADVHATDQQPAGAFVTQIVPAEVDSRYVLVLTSAGTETYGFDEARQAPRMAAWETSGPLQEKLGGM